MTGRHLLTDPRIELFNTSFPPSKTEFGLQILGTAPLQIMVEYTVLLKCLLYFQAGTVCFMTIDQVNKCIISGVRTMVTWAALTGSGAFINPKGIP